MQSIIEVSARHIHLNQEDCSILFGKEALKELRPLSQKNFAAEESVNLSGPKGQLDKVRVVGPLRSFSQVEISQTDALKLGIPAPLRISGDLPGATIKIIGPSGTIEKDIAILAVRHCHLNPHEADSLGLKQGDKISVEVDGARSLIFHDIVVRIEENFNSCIQIDTDEANAGLINNGDAVKIIRFKNDFNC